MRFSFIVRVWLLITMLLHAAGASAAVLGPQGTGHTDCGGLDASGKLQKPCGFSPASFASESLDKCPDGNIFDLGKGSCWSCPAGYSRGITTAPIDSARGCRKPNPNVRGEYVSASPPRSLGKACPEGSFFDPIRDGECWSCPAGFKRSAAPIDWADACVVLASENYARINRFNRATGVFKTDCPRGQFWDASDGYCYACPAGFNRSGYPLTDAKACSQAVSAQQSRATPRGKPQCKPGEFVDFLRDPKAGGECWACPEATDRTVFPVDGPKACERGGGFDYARATETGAPFCTTGQIFDLVNTTHPKVQEKLRAQFGRIPDGLRGNSAGTCWTCKPGFRRTLFAVWSPNACESNGIDWQMPKYKHPGLFGLRGAEAVVNKLIADRTLIEEVAADQAPQLSKSLNRVVTPEEAIQMGWSDINERPEHSGVLALAVYFQMLAAAADPAQSTPDEQALINSFAAAVTHYRSFLADEALRAYDVWDAADKKRNAAYNAVMIAGVSVAAAATGFGATAGLYAMAVDDVKNMMWPVPSFPEITLESVLDYAVDEATGEVQGQVQGFLYQKAFLSDKVLAKRFPHKRGAALQTAIKNARKAATGGQEAIQKAAINMVKTKLIKKTATQAAQKAAFKAMESALMSAGPQILVEVGIEIVTSFVQNKIDRANARPSLTTALAEAKRPYEIRRQMETVDGLADIENEWAVVISGDAGLSDGGAALRKAVQANMANPIAPPAAASANTAVSAATSRVVAAASNTPVGTPAAATKAAAQMNGVVAFDIVADKAGTCVQAMPNGLALMPCQRPNPSHWVSVEGQLRLAADDKQCLTATPGVPTLAACNKDPATQQWSFNAGEIKAGTNVCLEVRGRGVATAPCVPGKPMQKWQAEVLK